MGLLLMRNTNINITVEPSPHPVKMMNDSFDTHISNIDAPSASPVTDPVPRGLDDSHGTVHTVRTALTDVSDVGGGDEVRTASSSNSACADSGARQEAHFHNILIKDSIEVQKDHQVNDDEPHEDHPHLEDYLIPHHTHIESPAETGECCPREVSPVVEEVAPTDAETTSTDEEVTLADEEVAPTATDERFTPTEEEDPREVASMIEEVTTTDAETTSTDEEGTSADEEVTPTATDEGFTPTEDVRPTEDKVAPTDEAASIQECCIQDEPVTSKPPDQAKPKRGVQFGTVLVRDYGMIMGDHPCCSYGPPLTLEWDYTEYNPIDIDDYEFHHPPRRNLREMGLNYYQRKALLTDAGYTLEDFKLKKKELSRAKINRGITRSIVSHYPLAKAEDAVESARRKFKRLLKDDHWKKQKSLYAK